MIKLPTNQDPTLSIDAAAPPMSRTGDSAICAFFTAVTVFVKPRDRINDN